MFDEIGDGIFRRQYEFLALNIGVIIGSDGVLVIDDLVDTGRTLEAARTLFPKAHFASVYAKPQGKPLVDSFVTEVSQDTWIYFPWDLQLAYAPPMRGDG